MCILSRSLKVSSNAVQGLQGKIKKYISQPTRDQGAIFVDQSVRLKGKKSRKDTASSGKLVSTIGA